jgi:hypothetical protein
MIPPLLLFAADAVPQKKARLQRTRSELCRVETLAYRFAARMRFGARVVAVFGVVEDALEPATRAQKQFAPKCYTNTPPSRSGEDGRSSPAPARFRPSLQSFVAAKETACQHQA